MYQSKFCEVSFNEELNIVFVKWKKFCSGNDYREPLLYALDILKTREGCNFAADTTDGFENEYEDTQWLLNEFIPRSTETSCKIVFFITRHDKHLEVELEGQSIELRKYFKVYTCFSLEEVRQILEKENNIVQTIQEIESETSAEVSNKTHLRPWPRYWARALDISIFSFIPWRIILYFSKFPQSTIKIINLLDSIALTAFAILLIEPLVISKFGITPGKWALGIKITKISGKRLTIKEAFKRSYLVWLKGYGAAIPIVSFLR